MATTEVEFEFDVDGLSEQEAIEKLELLDELVSEVRELLDELQDASVKVKTTTNDSGIE